jgi:hypothetical protein
MPRAEFEPTIPAIEWAMTIRPLVLTATVIGFKNGYQHKNIDTWKTELYKLCLSYPFLATDPEARVRFPPLPEKKVVGLERGPLSLVSTTEELLDRKIAAPV